MKKSENNTKNAHTIYESNGETARLEILEGGKEEKWRDAGAINLLPEDKDISTKETKVKHVVDSVKKKLRGEKYYTYRHSPDGIDTNLLIMLHGAGDSHSAYDRLGKSMSLPQTAVLSISASIPDMFVTIPFELGHTWFEEVDYFQTGMALPSNHPRRLRSLKSAVASLKAILSLLVKDNGWLPEHIILFGFSCGACLAMETALDILLSDGDSTLSPSRPLGGAICVAGGVKINHKRTKDKETKDTSSINSTPILVVVGSNDPSFPPMQAKESKAIYDTLSHDKKSNVLIYTKKDKGHTMISSAEEMRAIMTFISTKLVKRMTGLEDIAKR